MKVLGRLFLGEVIKSWGAEVFLGLEYLAMLEGISEEQVL